MQHVNVLVLVNVDVPENIDGFVSGSLRSGARSRGGMLSFAGLP